MKTITVPADLTVHPPPYLIDGKQAAEPQILSFQRYAYQIWLDDARAFEGSFAKQVRWAKVVEKFAGIKPGDEIALEDEDYATLRKIVESPKGSFPGSFAVQLIAFPQAVLDAK